MDVVAQLLHLLNIIWGRITYLIGVPIQAFGEWAWRDTAYYLLSPEIFLLVGVMLICIIEIFSKRDNWVLASWIGIFALLGNFAMTVHMMYYTSRYYTYALGYWWGGLETLDPYAIFFKQLLDWGDILLFLALFGYKPLKQYRVEFIVLMLTGTIAFDLMVGSSDLLAVYVMTEFGGICSYLLAAFYKKELRSLESGLKYFITGATSSTAMLFAMSILYGALNTTNMYEIKTALISGGAVLPPVIFSVVLMLVALGYKIGLAPFHLYIADVYEGAPTPVAAYIAIFPKVAGYAVLLRLLFTAFAELEYVWVPVMLTMAILSMTFGNVQAMRQTSFKRMMGFSGVGHMGYIMIGVIAASYASSDETLQLGFYAAMYYMLVYFFMNLGIFLVAMVVESHGGSDHLDSYNGLLYRNPFLCILMTILLLALIGLPPTTGFWAKFLLFQSISYYHAFNPPWNLLLIVFAVITTVISAYYYMKLAYRMWVLPPPLEAKRKLEPILFMRIAIAVPALLIFALGIYAVSAPFEYVRGAWFLTSYTEGMSI
jgi:NADH-quinone oxidoreductase subunit N